MGSQLTYKPLDNIGVNGLNTQHNPTTLDTSWLTEVENIVFRESGRITFRKGLKQLVAGTSDEVGSLIEHKVGTTNKIFASVGAVIYTVDFGTPGAAFTNPFTANGTDSNWQFVNFNKQLFGFQGSHKPVNYNDSESTKWDEIEDRTGAVTPSGITTFDPSCGMGYYGRLWVGGITEEKDVVHYSDTLIPTTWYNDTSITTISTSTSYIINSVKEETNSITNNVGYKIESFKELDPTNGIASGTAYEIVSDTRTVIDDTLTDGLYYEIGGIKDENWSGVGASATAKVGDVFKCATGTDITSLGAVRLTWLNLGGENDSEAGDRFTASDANTDISEYGTVRLGDWSSFGGSANPKIDDLFTATSTISISDYGKVLLDWQVIGGPEIANVNDAFISKDTLPLTDITAYGAVIANYGLAGYIDLKTVWGTDEIIAIAPFYGKLIILGKHNIAIYKNPDEPSGLSLDEVVKGIGCVSRDSIQEIGDDLVFLSETGLRSLSRTTEKDNIPLQDLSSNITETLVRTIGQNRKVKSVYIEDEGIYLLSFVDLNKTYVFDFKHMTPNRNPRISTWSFTSTLQPRCFSYTESKGFLSGVDKSNGSIAEYSGYYDKKYTGAGPAYTNNSYNASFKTSWLDLGEGVSSSILKKLKAVVGGGAGTKIGVSWYTDFGSKKNYVTPFTVNVTVTLTPSLFRAKSYTGTGAKFLYGASHYTTSYGLKEYSIPLKGSAKYLQIAMESDTVGYSAVLQDLTLLIKQGKIL
jgi:hypothetical protein